MESTKSVNDNTAPQTAPGIDQLPFFDVDAAFASHEAFDEIVMSAHAQGPFARSERGLEVLGYKECVALLRDRRLHSDHMSLVESMGFPEGPAKEFKRTMLLSHGRDEYRTRIRQALTRAVGASVIEKQRPLIRQLVKDILQSLDPEENSDMLHKLALGVPSSLFCHWFGAPVEDAPWIAGLSDRIMKIFTSDPQYTPDIIAAYDELFPYVQKCIDRAMESPKDNLLAHFIAEHEAGHLSETELFYIVSMFNEASTDNTAHGIGTVVGRLLDDRQHWQQLIDNPELIPAAINETFRLSGRINTLIRYASQDLEFGGLWIPEGTTIHILIPAAHRDPKIFDAPLSYDPTRKDAHNLLDFGGGAYTCLGKFVAMIEIQEVVSELVSNYPNAHLEGFRVDTNSYVNETGELSVRLSGAGA
jgi:cytochrome P450